jgi:UDP-2,3-diacylglucosamine pyrophosphatase LpxH
VHTVVVSDLHLSEAHAPEPRRPLWMAYKRREHFVDEDFARFLDHVVERAEGPVELVLNGDIFDFDNVTQLPEEPEGRIHWLARLRGLGSEEWMSRFKMERIIADHPLWFETLAAFVADGHRAVFVIGNHDLELGWPSVQRLVRQALGVEQEDENVTFCAWFYLSEGDSYITHGHLYDPNCAGTDPIDPLIEVHGRPRMRIPFGDLAGRYMLNGMGYFNPHASDNYIMSGTEYLRFFFRYMLRTQPLLMWSWFWSAVATLFISLRDHWRPSMRDPLRVEEKVADIAKRSQATPSMVRRLAALNVPSSCTSPMWVLRELWLDRGFLFIGILLLAWQVVLHVNIAWPISPLWVFAALAVLIPPYLVYAARVKSTVFEQPLLDEERAELIHRITDARTVVMGHTHDPVNRQVGPVRYLNGGFWSPAFSNPECTERIGTQSFVWIRPTESGPRQAELYEWAPGATAAVLFDPDEATATTERPSARPSVSPPRLQPGQA